MAKKQNKKDTFTSKDYERLGRTMAFVLESGYPNKKRFYMFSFAKGVVVGLGTVVGASLVVALLAWVLSLLDTVPFLGPIFENVERTLESEAL